MKNSVVYKSTKTTPWSIQIASRRLRWSGHVNRLHEEAPAKKALQYVLQDHKRKCGRPKLTWLKLVEKQMKDVGNLDALITLSQDRIQWENIVKNWIQDVATAMYTVLLIDCFDLLKDRQNICDKNYFRPFLGF